MNYVKSLDLFGVEVQQIPSITGSGAPTTATEGAVGCFYMDTASENGDMYKCIAVTDGAYTWVPFGGGGGGADTAEIEAALDSIIAIQNSLIGGGSE